LRLIAGEPALIVVAALLAGGCGWAWPGGLTLAVVLRSPSAPAWAACASFALLAACTVTATRRLGS